MGAKVFFLASIQACSPSIKQLALARHGFDYQESQKHQGGPCQRWCSRCPVQQMPRDSKNSLNPCSRCPMTAKTLNPCSRCPSSVNLRLWQEGCLQLHAGMHSSRPSPPNHRGQRPNATALMPLHEHASPQPWPRRCERSERDFRPMSCPACQIEHTVSYWFQ
jgi:hypothetical protein